MFSEFQLRELCERIEAMNKTNQVKVLSMIVDAQRDRPEIMINQNTNGCYINITQLPDTLVQQLVSFIDYVATQETMLNVAEQVKQQYKDSYFAEEHNGSTTTTTTSSSSSSSSLSVTKKKKTT